MTGKIKKHSIIHYLSLFIILLSGIFLILIFPNNHFLRLAVVVSSAISYVCWGILHHYIHRDLTTIVILEYLSIGVLGILLVYPLLF